MAAHLRFFPPIPKMYSRVRSNLQPTVITPSPSPSFNDLVGDSLVDSTLLYGDLLYEYLSHETRGAPGTYHRERLANSSATDGTYNNFTTPLLPMDNPFFCPTPPWSPPPQELPPPRHRRKSFSQLSCSQATPLFSDARKRWYCNVCQDSFRDKYECERHIVNVGKRVKCLACGKNICARKDSRKRHYIKHCKKMDLGKDGGIRLEDAFIDV